MGIGRSNLWNGGGPKAIRLGRKGADLAPDPCGSGGLFESDPNRSFGRCGARECHSMLCCMKPKGLFRERNGWGDQHSVRVKYDERQEIDLPEDPYRERGYQPPFDELPWKDDPANDA